MEPTIGLLALAGRPVSPRLSGNNQNHNRSNDSLRVFRQANGIPPVVVEGSYTLQPFIVSRWFNNVGIAAQSVGFADIFGIVGLAQDHNGNFAVYVMRFNDLQQIPAVLPVG